MGKPYENENHGNQLQLIRQDDIFGSKDITTGSNEEEIKAKYKGSQKSICHIKTSLEKQVAVQVSNLRP